MPEKPSGSGAGTGDVLLMVGTTKGAFVYTADADRRSWRADGPHFPGEEVYALALDRRAERPVLWAAPGSPFWGSTLRRSDDLGASWSDKDERPVKFPEASGLSLERVWQIAPGPADQPDVMYLGVEPTCLFESRDGGDSWGPVAGFLDHEHRKYWTPGNGLSSIGLEADQGTVGEVFEELRARLPALYDRIFNEQRELRPHVNVFVGRADIRGSGGLATPLAGDSEVVILPSVSGG